MMDAEEFFRDAWEIHIMNGEFSDNPTAEQIYGKTKPDEIEYFALPEQIDEEGNPYVYQNIPLKAVVERYRTELEDHDSTYTKRFESAIERAHDVEFDDQDVDTRISGEVTARTAVCDGDIYILERTMEKLGL